MTEIAQPRAALLEDINPVASQVLDEAGFEVVTFPKDITVPELEEVASQNNFIGVRSGPAVPASVLASGNELQAVAGFCVSPKIDHEAAEDNGVAVFNSIHENTRSVAEHVINSVYMLLRRSGEHNSAMHAGTWTKTDERSFEVRGKTLGILGYGTIGTQASILAENNNMNVVYFDPKTKFPSYGGAQKLSSFEQLLEQSDILTLHVPETPATKNIINAAAISAMKKGSYIINAARGGLVDYEAVAEALDSGQLNGVAVDVYVDEPSKKGADFAHPLQGHPKAILTPHIAGSTKEAQESIAVVVAEKIVSYWSTSDPYDSITLPKVEMPYQEPDQLRVTFIHANRPGAMTMASAVLSEAGLNVVGQNLKVDTDTDVGYAYFDIDSGTVTQSVLKALRDLDVTKRARLIG